MTGVAIFHAKVNMQHEVGKFDGWAFAFFTITPVELLLIAMCLTAAYRNLSKSIEKYFAAILHDEARRIKTTFILFATSLVTRALVFLIVSLVPIIEENYKTLVFHFMDIVWDILPLTVTLSYHHFCFSAQEEYLR